MTEDIEPIGPRPDLPPWDEMTPEQKRQVNELAQALPDYPGGPWHGARKGGKSVAQQVIDRLGPLIGPERPSPVLDRMRRVVQDELAAYDEMLKREESETTTFHAEPVVYWHRDDGASAFRPSETAAQPAEVLDITDLMEELWLRLVANVGLLAGVVSPACFGWPPGTRAVVRR